MNFNDFFTFDSNKKKFLMIISIIIFAFAYLGFVAFSNNIWFDESFSTYLVLKHDFKTILSLSRFDMHPPTYYLYVKMLTLIFGNSIAVLKLASVVPFIGMLLLGFFPIRRIFGNRMGYVMMLFTISMPHVMKFSTEIRNYSLAMFGVLGTVVYAIDLLKNKNKLNMKTIVLFGVFSLFAIYIHYYALIMVVLIHLAVLLNLFHYKDFKVMIRCLIMDLVVAVCYIPWLSILIFQANSVKDGFWVPPITIKTLVQLLAVQFYSGDQYFSTIAVICFTTTILVTSIFIYGILKYIKLIKSKNTQRSDWDIMFSVIIIPYIITFLLFLAVSLTIRPILVWRYLLVLVPALWLVLSFVICNINKKIVFKAIVIYFIFMAVFNFARTIPAEYNNDFPKFMNFYNEKVKPDDVFVHATGTSLGVFSCFYNNDRYMQKDGIFTYYYIFDAKPFKDINELQNKKRNVWVVLMKGTSIPDNLSKNNSFEHVDTLKIVDTYEIYKLK